MRGRLAFRRSHIYWGALLLLVALIAFPLRTPIAQAVSYLLKNQPDTSRATHSDAVLHIYNTGTSPNGMGAGVTGENLATSGVGYSYGLFGITHAADRGVGFNGWAATGGTTGGTKGVRATADGENNIGIEGVAYASPGFGLGMDGASYAEYGVGVWGSAYNKDNGPNFGVYGSNESFVSGAGVYGGSGTSASYGVEGEVYGDGYGLFTTDQLYVGAGCVGCGSSSALAVNSDNETLNTGDLVALVGTIESSLAGSTPKLSVIKASQFNAEQVVGVVKEGISIETKEIPNFRCVHLNNEPEPMPTPGSPNTNLEGTRATWQSLRTYCVENATILHTRVSPSPSPISPSSYLTVVTNGLAYVRVEGPVALGQLLVPSSVPGVAKAAPVAPAPGTVLGKVAGSRDPDTGLVPVFVTLR